MDAPALRAEFPVCEALAYLNSGTCGPLPRAAVEALTRAAADAAARGRAHDYYEAAFETWSRLRAAYAGVLGADPVDVALTTSTSEGVTRAIASLNLGPGDEVLLAEREHPGLFGPLAAARARFGFDLRVVPAATLPDEIGGATRLVACSHVAWTTGEMAPAFSGIPAEVAVLLDGAQGAGAVPVDLGSLGCAFYAASGQKWMCGPVGTGMLWVSPAWREQLSPPHTAYANLEDVALGIDALPWPDARAFDTPSLSPELAAAALAAHDVLAAHGWPAVQARARDLAAALARDLASAGHEVTPRGETTLVSWASPDPEAQAAALSEAGVVVRSFPGLPWLRASVGAWNDERDLERLLAALH
jgi:L-cysteine/cystine lyase